MASIDGGSAPAESGFVQGISELALWVNDLGRSVAFYRDRLGFTLFDYTEGVNAFLRSGDVVLALFAPVIEGNTPVSQEYLRRYGGPRGSVYHVGFKVAPDALDERAQSLIAAGVSVQGPMNFGTGRRSYFFEDPDQHFIELTDR
ncbi:MAG TPA: VOC family protein [Armatimonadota bacterium]|nr:VOC family protein [Armatimonadota bacterium]